MTFAHAEMATKADAAVSALSPKAYLKKEAAKILPEEAISAFGTTAKYAMLTNIYIIPKPMNADGAAILKTLSGFFISPKA